LCGFDSAAIIFATAKAAAKEFGLGKFIIGPHMRLQEWVAEEKGYFKDEDLDYEFLPSTGLTTISVKSATELPKSQIRGAYQSIEDGRQCDISSACHWTVNMAAAAGHGRLWAGAYSMTPAGIFAAPDSNIRTPADLAGVPITVGYQSGSHYTTIQALEPILKREEIKLHFGGTLFLRLELLIDREVPVVTLFSGPMYLAEQLGYRKILDCSFMTAATVRENTSEEDVLKYYRALKKAQVDVDLHHQKYTHYYRKEFPARFHDVMDPRLFGPGERIVFSPYTKAMYDETQAWVESWNIFEEGIKARKNYDESVALPARS
jgi:NitT/TauT family transport system substrate-binding protein